MGETCALVLIACGLWLAFRKIFDWRLIVSTVVGLVVVSGILHFADPDSCPNPVFMIFSGGFLFGAVSIANISALPNGPPVTVV